jgi:hypothetical protein
MMGHIAANAEQIDACVVAVIMKPTEGNTDPAVEVLTVGDNAVRLFGVSEFIRHEIYKQLEERE